MDILKYKGYEGTAELDMGRGVCRGKILLIHDLVTYESSAIAQLQKEFEDAVDDYLETCKELGRSPQIPLRGQFNVRVPPTLHKELVLRATADAASLNEVVIKACEAYVCHRDVNHTHSHNHVVTVVDQSQSLTRVASNSAGINWEAGGLRVH